MEVYPKIHPTTSSKISQINIQDSPRVIPNHPTYPKTDLFTPPKTKMDTQKDGLEKVIALQYMNKK